MTFRDTCASELAKRLDCGRVHRRSPAARRRTSDLEPIAHPKAPLKSAHSKRFATYAAYFASFAHFGFQPVVMGCKHAAEAIQLQPRRREYYANSARTMFAPCTRDSSLFRAQKRGCYFIPQSVVNVTRSAGTYSRTLRMRAATCSGASISMERTLITPAARFLMAAVLERVQHIATLQLLRKPRRARIRTNQRGGKERQVHLNQRPGA